MQRTLTLLLSLIVISACSSTKNAQRDLDSGNYRASMDRSIKALVGQKDKKRNQEHILLLESAFAKFRDRQLDKIELLRNSDSPSALEARYVTYRELDRVQRRIVPLLPLSIATERRNAVFEMVELGGDLQAARDAWVAQLYRDGVQRLATSRTKGDYRGAHALFEAVARFEPDYREVQALRDSARVKGTEHVLVRIENRTGRLLPVPVEELGGLNPQGMDAHWTRYNNRERQDLEFDFDLVLEIDRIDVGPDEMTERIQSKERWITDGEEIVRDPNGIIVKDSLGEPVTVERRILVQCEYQQFIQRKQVDLHADLVLQDRRTGELLDRKELGSSGLFEHVYARFVGDPRALDPQLASLALSIRMDYPDSATLMVEAFQELKSQMRVQVARYNRRGPIQSGPIAVLTD